MEIRFAYILQYPSSCGASRRRARDYVRHANSGARTSVPFPDVPESPDGSTSPIWFRRPTARRAFVLLATSGGLPTTTDENTPPVPATRGSYRTPRLWETAAATMARVETARAVAPDRVY